MRLATPLVLLLGLVSPPIAAADDGVPRDAATWCAARGGEPLVIDLHGVWHRLDGGRVRDDPDGTMTEVWRGALDGDRRADLVVRLHGGCGFQECLHEAFVACPDGTFASVLDAPVYAARVRVTRGRHRWAHLALEHVGERDPRGHRPRSWSRLRATADGYR